MKYIFFIVMPMVLSAQVHYAKVEPFERVTLKAAVSGEVVDANLSAEGETPKRSRIIHIDDALDRINLSNAHKSLDLIKKMLDINQESAKSLKESMTRLRASYERIKGLSTASKSQKDSAYNSYASAKTQYLATREKIETLKKQILDTQYRIAQLQDTIAKKSIYLDGRYLNALLVRKGDFVAPGTPLAKIDDLRQGKLVLFLDPEEVENISDKAVYLDDNRTDYKIDKVWRVADEKYISSYRAEIYLPKSPELFSKLIKVEIK